MSTSKNRDAIARELDVPLGPEYVSFKNAHAYVEGHKVVNLANTIFGFDGWSSEIRSMSVDYVEEKNSRYTLGVSCTSRVTLKSGVFREDVGYGSSVNMPNRFQAYDKARKEAATDALKRTLRLFGESLGNCLYNKEYVDVIRRMRGVKSTFDVEDMRRPAKRVRSEAVQVPIAQITAPIAPAPTPTAPTAPTAPIAPTAAVANPAPAAAEYPEVTDIPIFDSEDDIDDVSAKPANITPADAVFVTADIASLVTAPENMGTPIPASAIFDPLKPSGMKTTVRQDVSMPVKKLHK